MISFLIIDDTDNADYFLYKYNFSKKDQNRIKIIDNFFKEKITSKSFLPNTMNKIFYYDGKQAVLDILNFQLLRVKKNKENLIQLINFYKNKSIPKMPIGAEDLMIKFRISEGKHLGTKLKMIEKEWIKNDFKISEKQVDNIVKN